MQTLKIKKINPSAQIPKRSIDTDACYDVVAVSKEELGDGRVVYGLGFALELPPNSQVDMRPRSSIHKTGMVLCNSIGTMDEGYRGEYKAVFYHLIPSLPAYEVGDKIAQIQLRFRQDVEFELVPELSDTVRGDGGFGHTGK